MPSDTIQKPFVVGEVVNIPCIVTAVGGTTTQPALTLSTKYVGWDGNPDTLSVDSKQVIKDS